MTERPICHMPRCDVQIPPDEMFCAGHLYLNRAERRRADEFVRQSRALLARIKTKEIPQ